MVEAADTEVPEGAQRDKRTSTPGLAHARLNYGRTEKVVKVDVSDSVVKARQEVKETFTPDVLGLRGPRWDASVATSPSKWGRNASDCALSNKLTPKLIDARDFRTLKGATHSPTKGSAEFTRGPFVGWNISTATDTAELRQRLEQQTTQALRATHKKHSILVKAYKPPLRQQEEVIERVRHEKMSRGIDMAELVAKYGPEGAAAMRDALILRRRKGIDNPYGTLAQRSLFRARARPSDIEAVKELRFGGALDEEDGEDSGEQEEGRVDEAAAAAAAREASAAEQGRTSVGGAAPPAEALESAAQEAAGVGMVKGVGGEDSAAAPSSGPASGA